MEVLDLDCAVAAQHRGERAIRADERARVRERRPGGRLRAPDLEAGDGLVRLGAAAERVDERVRAPHGLEEEPDGARLGILGEEAKVVGRVRHGLGARGDDAADSDAAAEGEERVRDRPRLAEHGDVPRAVVSPGRPFHAAGPPGT